MDSLLTERLERSIAEGVAMARDPRPISALMAEQGDQASPVFDCPPLPRIVAGLRYGFTPEEEAEAPQRPDFQRMVRIYWRFRPVSFWILGRYLAEGESFPFAAALEQHLREEAGIGSLMAMEAGFTRRLAEAIRRLSGATEAWRQLRDRILFWETTSYRVVAEFPQPTELGAFGDQESEPFNYGEEFEDGLKVHLEEIRSSKLHIAATRPSGARGAEKLTVTLLGESGASRPATLSLQPSGETSGGRTEVGAFQDVRTALGPKCLVILSADPFPDVE